MLTLSILPSTYFPYVSIRRYQDEFINAIYDAVKLGRHVAVAAASGLGKTVGVLSATLPFVRGNGLRILYIARTHKECDRAIEELKVIGERSHVSGISIRGRSEACFNKAISSHALDARTAMEICSEFKKRGLCNFYEKLRSKRSDVEEALKRITARPTLFGEVTEICRNLNVCAYELSKLVIGKVDVAAMSYNYLFHDEIRHTIIKSFERPLSSYILVLDEAHNLPDIAVSLAGDRISTSTFKRAESEAGQFKFSSARRFIASTRRVIEDIQQNIAGGEVALPAPILLKRIAEDHGMEPNRLESVLGSLHECGESIKLSLLERGRPPRSSIHRVASFLIKWLETSARENYVHVLTKRKSGRRPTGFGPAYLEIVCLDPGQVTSHVLSSVHSSVSMSGTLEPIECYVDVVGLPKGTKGYLFDSPFPRENIKIVICKGVTTALSKRSSPMYQKLSARIAEAVNSTPINTGVFVASYDVLGGLMEAGLKNLVQKPLFVEESESTSTRNDALIELFRRSASSGGGVLLGVQGGRNSEGLDLPGDLLSTVVVVGVPYARPTPRVTASIDYYESKFPKKGKEYGYNVPAVRKAAQAAGRAFRSVDDRGVVVFLDHRFARPPCTSLLPSWIRESYKLLPDEDGLISRELERFYGCHISPGI
nr:ATP-dependent DNA helicase [Candidatus Njordarchaeum guaymaensis]